MEKLDFSPCWYFFQVLKRISEMQRWVSAIQVQTCARCGAIHITAQILLVKDSFIRIHKGETAALRTCFSYSSYRSSK